MGLKGRFSALLILFPPARQHALCQAIFSADLSRTLLSCGDLAHDLQFELATVDSFVHLSSPCLLPVYDISEKLTSFTVRSNGFSPEHTLDDIHYGWRGWWKRWDKYKV